MDKQLIARRFAKAASAYEREATIQRSIAAHTVELLQQVWTPAHTPDILEIGCGTGFLTQLLLARYAPRSLWANDLCVTMENHLPPYKKETIKFLPGDAEEIDFPMNEDLIASCSTIQWFSDTPRFFQRCREALTENGWIAISTFGPNNFHEIKELTGQGLSYPQLKEWQEQIEPYFHLHIAKEEKQTLLFDSPMNVLRHLKDTGVTGTGPYQWNREKLSEFCNKYINLFSRNDGKVTLTYHPIYLIGQKKI